MKIIPPRQLDDLTPLQRAQICRLYIIERASISTLEEGFRTSAENISTVLDDAGIVQREQPPVIRDGLTPQETNLLLEYYEPYGRVRLLAEAFSVLPETIQWLLKEHNVILHEPCSKYMQRREEELAKWKQKQQPSASPIPLAPLTPSIPSEFSALSP